MLRTELKGVLHWGDQVAMGHYLHHNPDAWREIPDGWNYCIIFRKPWTYRITPGGRVESLLGHQFTSCTATAARWSPG